MMSERLLGARHRARIRRAMMRTKREAHKQGLDVSKCVVEVEDDGSWFGWCQVPSFRPRYRCLRYHARRDWSRVYLEVKFAGERFWGSSFRVAVIDQASFPHAPDCDCEVR